MTSICEDPGKSSWPELMGTKGEYAKEVIARENPKMKAEIISDTTPIREIFKCGRVLVWVNDNGIDSVELASCSWRPAGVFTVP